MSNEASVVGGPGRTLSENERICTIRALSVEAHDIAQGTASAPRGASGLHALPPSVAEALSQARDIEQAQLFCRKLARSHYENFSVVSVLLPKRLRQDFCNVYAFCRTADDLGDEIHDPEVATAQLEHLRELTRQCYAGKSDTTLFAALSATIAKHEIPIEPFLDLLDAFEQDQRVTRYETFDQLLDYCKRSANPVGRIVLYMCGCRDPKAQIFSDYTCSALQLANFWQDVRRDLFELNRIYLPADQMRRVDVTEEQLRDERVDENYKSLIHCEVDRAAGMFDIGDELIPMLDPSVRGHIALFSKGGRAILQAIRDQDYDTLSSRPSLSGWQKSRLLISAVGAKIGSISA
jgi:squalene synthase HpnC